jgi:hypothetical protein
VCSFENTRTEASLPQQITFHYAKSWVKCKSSGLGNTGSTNCQLQHQAPTPLPPSHPSQPNSLYLCLFISVTCLGHSRSANSSSFLLNHLPDVLNVYRCTLGALTILRIQLRLVNVNKSMQRRYTYLYMHTKNVYIGRAGKQTTPVRPWTVAGICAIILVMSPVSCEGPDPSLDTNTISFVFISGFDTFVAISGSLSTIICERRLHARSGQRPHARTRQPVNPCIHAHE